MIVETGPNGSTSCTARGRPGIVRAKQDRREEGAAGDRRLGRRIARDDPRAGRFQLAIFCRTSSRWREANERAHARVLGARVADLGPASRSASASWTASRYCGRRHGAADGRAFLPRLHRHLDRDLADEQVEFGRAGRRVGAEHRGVEAVLLGDEADGLAHDGRMRAQLQRGRRRAGEADDVLPGQVVEQVADAADDQLDRACREARRPRSSPGTPLR